MIDDGDRPHPASRVEHAASRRPTPLVAWSPLIAAHGATAPRPHPPRWPAGRRRRAHRRSAPIPHSQHCRRDQARTSGSRPQPGHHPSPADPICSLSTVALEKSL
jgi:hypothetical protein